MVKQPSYLHSLCNLLRKTVQLRTSSLGFHLVHLRLNWDFYVAAPILYWIIPITTALVLSQSTSGMPWNRRFGGLVYCSFLSASASNVATFFCRSPICYSLAASQDFIVCISVFRCATCMAAHTAWMRIGAINSIISNTVVSCSFLVPVFGVSPCTLRCSLNCSSSVAKQPRPCC